TRTTLNEVGHELVEQLARDHTVARADDRIGDLAVEHPEIPVRHRRGLFDIAKRFDEIRFPRYRHPGNVKIFLAAKRLNAVVGVRRNLAVTEEIVFYPELI